MDGSLPFTNTNYERIDASVMLEEEQHNIDRYLPVKIGQFLLARYLVVGKLGYDMISTTWLARDFSVPGTHVVIKVFTAECQPPWELTTTQILNTTWNLYAAHPGAIFIHGSTDHFVGWNGAQSHSCMVQTPLWHSLEEARRRKPEGTYRQDTIRGAIVCLLQALEYLHTKCGLAHGDIQPSNLLLAPHDRSFIGKFEQAEMDTPCARKQLPDGRFVYSSRKFDNPCTLHSSILLSNFGAATLPTTRTVEMVRPSMYTAPEIILKAPVTYDVDIWSLGVVIWELVEGKPLFRGGPYSKAAHLAQMVAMFGLPKPEFLHGSTAMAEFASVFFTRGNKVFRGVGNADWNVFKGRRLERMERRYRGAEKEHFLRFMKSMLVWYPLDRKSASELLQDPWLNGNISDT